VTFGRILDLDSDGRVLILWQSQPHIGLHAQTQAGGNGVLAVNRVLINRWVGPSSIDGKCGRVER
jgi:hypothetical protein